MGIGDVVSYMNNRFNQDNDNEYNFFIGSKPMVIRLDDVTAVSTWGCGAIVCIGDIIHFISEDDGYWFCHTDGVQSTFSIAWSKGFYEAMKRLDEYVKDNGEPVYYTYGTDNKGNPILGPICNYRLCHKK